MSRVIAYRYKPISFRGRHNATKSKCLLMLRYSRTAQQKSGWLTARDLSLLTGLPYASIRSSVRNWVRFGYIRRDQGRLSTSRRVYMYILAPKGRAWLERHERHMPIERYEREVEDATGMKGSELGLPLLRLVTH